MALDTSRKYSFIKTSLHVIVVIVNIKKKLHPILAQNCTFLLKLKCRHRKNHYDLIE